MIGAGRMLRTGAVGAIAKGKGPQPWAAEPKKPMLVAMMVKVKGWLGLKKAA